MASSTLPLLRSRDRNARTENAASITRLAEGSIDAVLSRCAPPALARPARRLFILSLHIPGETNLPDRCAGRAERIISLISTQKLRSC